MLPYDAEWPRRFEAERALLERVLEPWLDGGIHHVGSTSVPGLAAKPVIDMVAGVRDLDEARAAFGPLAEHGYEYAFHRPNAHRFAKPGLEPSWAATHHLHLTEPGSDVWVERLAFRDALRADAVLAREYEALKLRCAVDHPRNAAGYTRAKRPFVARVLASSGIELRAIRGRQCVLRRTTEEDVDLLLGWFADSEVYRWWGGRPRTRDEVLAKYVGRRRPRVESWVIEVRGEPVGYIQSHTGYEPYHPPGEGGIDLVIAPAARRQGLGSDAAGALVGHLLRERGWRRVTVDPARDNPHALAFWRAVGFRHVHDLDDGPAELLEIRVDVSSTGAGGDPASVSAQDLNPPESPRIAEAEIVVDPDTGVECLLARDADGRRIAFAFEVESDAPGVSLVDPARLPDAAGPEDSPERFDAVVEPRADEWLPSLVTHPVAAEWLRRIEEHSPEAYRRWFEQREYETGGEQGSGGGAV